MSTNRAPILFRCDGSVSTGYEAFYQCLTLASAMQRRRRGTHFYSFLDPLTLAQQIHRSGNEWQGAPQTLGSDGDLAATIREVYRLGAGAIVVAGTDVPEAYLAALRNLGIVVVAIDTQANYASPADLVVNPLLGPSRADYTAKHKGTEFLIGANYTLVRPFFRRMRPIRAVEPAQPFRGMVAMGDDDTLGDSLARAEQLLAVSKVAKVDVVVRPHHPQLEQLKALAATSEGRLDVVTEPQEISTRLARVHFAITSGDSWSAEMACLGIPQLMLVQQLRHVPSAARLEEENAGTLLGESHTVTASMLKNAVTGLLADNLERSAMARAGRKLVDARGPDRLVNGIEIMMQRQTQTVTLGVAA